MNETEHSQYQPQDLEEDVQNANALNLTWTLGMNYTIMNGCHNLTTEHRREIFYASAHTGVIYDYENGTQRLLQGHCNKITCTALCPAEDIIVTADEGPDSMLVVWDIKSAVPRKTIFDPHPRGVECMDITQDGTYIVTVSKEDKSGEKQEITVWDWKSPNKSRVISHPVEKVKDYIRYVAFDPNRPREFATTGKKKIVFWKWEVGAQGFEFYSPSYSDRKSEFTQTVFIPGNDCQEVVTGTTDGHIVVWDISLIMEDYSQPEERRKIKIVNLMNPLNKTETSAKKPVPEINILKIWGNYLVVGSSVGSVRFYDFQYTIVAWFEDTGVSSITSISFSLENKMVYGDKSKDDDSNEPFICPDFIVVDQECSVFELKAEQFSKIDVKEKEPTLRMKLLRNPICFFAVCPKPGVPHIYICEKQYEKDDEGKEKKAYLWRWDYYNKQCTLEKIRDFEDSKKLPTCMEFSPDGNHLAVGTASGHVEFYDWQGKKWQHVGQKLQISTARTNEVPRPLMITFTADSKYLAVADNLEYISIFKFDTFESDGNPEWKFYLKNRAHLAPIRSIAFGESMNENGEIKYRLFSIGDDKNLVEYDIYSTQAAKDKYEVKLQVAKITPVEQESNPCACIWYPVDLYKQDILLTVNENYKIKLWDTHSVEDKKTKKTCLGPTYGGPINKFLTVRTSNDKEFYLAYSTKEKICGLIKLPIDGNPNNSMGLISHPGAITGIGVSSDGKYLFTAGGNDFTINVWTIDVSAINPNAYFQNNEDIFPDLLEGGREGQMYRDLKDFFYYSQIRFKDENTTKARKLEGTVPLNEIPNLMRALGYYPTEMEIKNMQDEIRYSEILEEGKTVEHCDLKTFVGLFVNHRPVFGIGKKNIQEALETITLLNDAPEKGVLPKEDFMKLLQHYGERMTEKEIQECLQYLIGDTDIQDSDINADVLKDILGFEELNDEQGENTEQFE